MSRWERYHAGSYWCYRQCAVQVVWHKPAHQALALWGLSCSALTTHHHMWRCTHSRVTTRSTNTPLGRGQRTQDRQVKTKTASEMCLMNTGSNLCGAKHFLNCARGYLFHVRPGHDGISQISVWLVSLQEGPPSVSWQSRILFLWPRPHEVEQELHGLQGSYTGQGSSVHTRVPFSHTLRI